MIDLRRLSAAIVLLAAIFGADTGARAAPTAPFSGPFVQLIDMTRYTNHADISIQFSCSMRYLSNRPVSHGARTSIRLLLGPDCGPPLQTILPELPLVGGCGKLVTGARVESMMPGEITLELSFSRPMDFVMAPTPSGLGLRVRLLNTARRHAAGVLLAAPQAPTGYAVNLDSSRAAYARSAVVAAAAALQTQAYVSETTLGDGRWYRLRVGPFATHAEAERVLRIALARYPRAWIAQSAAHVGIATVGHAGVRAAAESAPTDPPLPGAVRAKLMQQARRALERHHYPRAIDLLTRLVRQPEYPQRAAAQELLGLARERSGQLAEAKAEYQEYLLRYPHGAGARRVRMRLQSLAEASLAAPSAGEFGASGANARRHLTLAGSASLSYEFGRDQTITAGTTTTTNSVDTALVYGDFLMRERSRRYDLSARVDGGYTKNIASSPPTGSQDQLAAAYAQVIDRYWGLTARFGRQSLASQGVVGLFDGLYVGYRINSRWRISGAAGLPAYTSYSAVSARQKFGTVTADYSPAGRPWAFEAYLFDQTNAIGTERRSIGWQTRYAAAGRTAVMLVDYDFAFRQLNSLTLIGNTRVGPSWVIGFDADNRRSPMLELSNALIGQSTTDLQTLATQYTPSQIQQMALDRTATSNTFVISADRPLGERWEFMVDLSALELSGTRASYGVVATQSTGLDKNASMQVAGSSLLQAGDLHVLGVRVDDSPTARSATVSWDARFIVHGAWRMGPRLSVEELNDPTLGGKQTIYLPQLQTDWTGKASVFEFTAGYQMLNQQTLVQPQSLTGQPVSSALSQRSLYVSLAYRVRF